MAKDRQLKSQPPHPQLRAATRLPGAFTFIFHRNCTWVDGYKVFSVSHGHTGKREERRARREAPGIPGRHPRSRPHDPRLRPPPLAAASAKETGEAALTGAGKDRRPPPPRPRARPLAARIPRLTPVGRGSAPETPPAGYPGRPQDLEVSRNGGQEVIRAPPKAPDPFSGLRGTHPRARGSGSPNGGARRAPLPAWGRQPGGQAGRAGGAGRAAGEGTGLGRLGAAVLVCSRLRLLGSALPTARRPGAPRTLGPPRTPGPRRTELCRHHFRRKGRARRRTCTPGHGRRK